LKHLKIAVTGGIGSGKSLFCSYLAEAGYPVLNADTIAKELLQYNKTLRSKIIKAFGEQSYAGGVLNKEFLAAAVFSNPANVKKINQIIHPVVIARSSVLLEELLARHLLVFYESALIFEANMAHLFDRVVLLSADENIRVERIIVRDRTTSGKVKKRVSNQLTDEEKKLRADVVIVNDGTREALREKALELIKRLLNPVR